MNAFCFASIQLRLSRFHIYDAHTCSTMHSNYSIQLFLLAFRFLRTICVHLKMFTDVYLFQFVIFGWRQNIFHFHTRKIKYRNQSRVKAFNGVIFMLHFCAYHHDGSARRLDRCRDNWLNFIYFI